MGKYSKGDWRPREMKSVRSLSGIRPQGSWAPGPTACTASLRARINKCFGQAGALGSQEAWPKLIGVPFIL